MFKNVARFALFIIIFSLTVSVIHAQDSQTVTLDWFAGHYQYKHDLFRYGFMPLPEEGESNGVAVECFDVTDPANAHYEITQESGLWHAYTLDQAEVRLDVSYYDNPIVFNRVAEAFTGTETELGAWINSLHCAEEQLPVIDGTIILRKDQVIAIRQQDAAYLRVQVGEYASAPVSWTEQGGWNLGGALPGLSAFTTDYGIVFIGIPGERDLFANDTTDTAMEWLNSEVGVMRFYTRDDLPVYSMVLYQPN